MANPLITPNMSLIEPAIGSTVSPTWAQDLNANMGTLDQHNHAPGSGVQITPAGLSISSDLSFLSNNAVQLRTTRYIPISLGSLTGVDVGAIVVNTSGDLYYVNSAGLQIQITNSSGIVGTPGSISGLVSPASASYVAATDTFVWQSGSSIAANMDAATYILRYPSTGYPTPAGNFIALQAPSSLATGYAVTFPATLPGSTSFVTETSLGQLGYISTVGGITGSNLVSSIVLPGNPSTVGSFTIGTSGATLSFGGTTLTLTNAMLVTFGGIFPNGTGGALLGATTTANTIYVKDTGSGSDFPLVVSATPGSTNGLMIVRGVVSAAGTGTSGEGFTVVRNSTGVYTVTFSASFADVPSVCATVQTSVGSGLVCHCMGLSSSSVQVEIFTSPTNASTNASFAFQAIGQRNA